MNIRKKFLIAPLFLAAVLISVGIFANHAYAGSATLNWNANTEPDLAGYRIYYGTSPRTGTCPTGGYPNNLSLGLVTTHTFNNLTDGMTWYFSVAAYDTSNNVSCFSSEVSKFLPAADTTPPTVSMTAPSAGATISGTVTVSANASDNVGVVGVQFRLDGVNLGTEDTASPYSISWNTTSASNGSHTLTAVARDAAGNQTTSASITVTVNNVVIDSTAPSSITNLSTSNIAQTSLQLNWTAPGDDGNVGTATSYDIRYSLSTITLSNWGSATQVTGEPTPLIAGTAQSMSISGLTANTTYYFAIRTTDDAGNVSGLSNVPSVTTQSFSLSVSLSATPNTGIGSLSNVSLTASVSGTQTGNINYTFYCNRSDSGTNITTPYDGKYDNQVITTFTATSLCSYSTAGTYSPKVIAERGILAAENRASVVVNLAPDTTPPTVSMTAPSAGSTISGTVTVSANASDNVGVVGVQFRLDGVNLGTEDTASPYSISWNTTSASNGSHTLTAVARDAAGNQTTSASITVTVNNVVVVSPAGGGGGGGGATIDTTPPQAPLNTKISRSGNSITIVWTNPSDSDFKGVLIIRKENSAPSSRTDGSTVYNNNLQNFIDSYIDSTKTYYYALYSFDANNNYSQPVILKAEPGQTQVVSQPSTQTTAPTSGTTPPTQTTTPSSPIVVPPTISSGYTFTRYLTVGKSGDDVEKLQEILAANPSIYPQQLITSYYGPITQKAVQKFQEMYGIASPSTPGYGDVGPLTRSKLNSLLSYQASYPSSATSSAEQARQALIETLKALIQQIEEQILQLVEKIKQLKIQQGIQ